MNDNLHHNSMPRQTDPTIIVTAVYHTQDGFELQLPTRLVHVCVFSFEVCDHSLEFRVESDRVEAGKIEGQSAPLGHEF